MNIGLIDYNLFNKIMYDGYNGITYKHNMQYANIYISVFILLSRYNNLDYYYSALYEYYFMHIRQLVFDKILCLKYYDQNKWNICYINSIYKTHRNDTVGTLKNFKIKLVITIEIYYFFNLK